jgi:hypothetical protein
MFSAADTFSVEKSIPDSHRFDKTQARGAVIQATTLSEYYKCESRAPTGQKFLVRGMQNVESNLRDTERKKRLRDCATAKTDFEAYRYIRKKNI